jgi:hypothetical protein
VQLLHALAELMRFVIGSAPPAIAPSTPDPYAKARERQSDLKKSVQLEIHKATINNTFDHIKTTSQTLNTVTGLLLTTYIALVVGFRKEVGFPEPLHWLSALAPAACWIGSLTLAFFQVIMQPGVDLAVSTYTHALQTYSEIIAIRRRQLRIPAILTLLGLIAFAVIFKPVFVDIPNAKPTSEQKQQKGGSG